MGAKKHSILIETVGTHYALAAEEMEVRRLAEERLPDDIAELRMFVEELGTMYVEVFELWAEGLTETESAAILNVPPNTVKSRRNKIRKFVRERLGVLRP